MTQFSLISRLIKLIRRPGFWLIIIALALITVPHYGEAFEHPTFLTQIFANLGMSRHSLERILYLGPIVWAGFLFGWKGAFITSLAALACMLPRASILSAHVTDSLFESGVVFLIGNVLALSFESLRKERERRTQLELAKLEVQKSEKRYRDLFENAFDAIWTHDLDGNIIAANKATEKLTGHSEDSLVGMNVKNFLSSENLRLAGQIRRKLMENEPIKQPYEQHITRKDSSEALVELATSLILDQGEVIGLQNIARDVTNHKRMQENLNYYLQQATRAQEDERKRISRELHDDTIQSLVALSRQLDVLASGDDLTDDNRLRLEEPMKLTNDIIRGLRRLSQDLRPATLDRFGLFPALEWLASDIVQFSGLETNVRVIGTERRFSEETELVSFRIVQEALRNVWRHSQATKAEITVEFGERTTKISVSDNGKGFDLPQTVGDLARDNKLGLVGMHERARLLGGTLSVESKTGKGTTVTVELMNERIN